MAGWLASKALAPVGIKLDRLIRSPLTALLVVVALSIISFQLQWLSSVDRIYYDFLIRQHNIDYADDIVLVTIDEASLGELGAWPWDRRVHAELLSRLSQADVVAFDIIFAEPQSSSLSPESAYSNQQTADTAFASAISNHGSVVLPMFIEQQYTGYAREVLPLPLLAKNVAGIGQVNVDFDNDGIVRGITTAAGMGTAYWPHLSIAILELQGSRDQYVRVSDRVDQNTNYGLVQGHHQNIRFLGEAGSVFGFSYIDVLRGQVEAEAFQDKTVFVGATARGLGDNFPTPEGVMSGVEFHASAYEALRTGSTVNALDDRWYLIFSVVVVLALCWILSRVSPTAFLLSSLAGILGIVLFSAITFHVFSLWLPVAPLVLAVVAFYPLWSWRRIQIALGYLKTELADLKNSSPIQQIESQALDRSLQGLVELGLLTSASVSTAKNGYRGTYRTTNVEGKQASTVVHIGGEELKIEVESPLSGAHGKRILAALLESYTLSEPLSDSSYELVEKTIEEISRVKAEASRMQKQMNQSMRRLQDAVLVVDAAGTVVFYNDAMAGITGATLQQGESIAGLHGVFGQLMWNSMLRKVMLERENVYQEFESSGREIFLCQAGPMSLLEGETEIFVFVFTDVTRLRNLEQSKNEALAFLSHDMRSPIVSQLALIEQSQRNAIVSSADHASGSTSGQTQILNKLAEFAERSLKYAEDFLMLSRAENLDEQSFQLVDMHGVIDVAYSNVVNQAALAGIELVTQRPREDCWVLGDSKLIERAIENLLNNAIQHSGTGKTIDLALRSDNDVVVEVGDSGQGIDKSLLPQLFEPYFRSRKKDSSTDVKDSSREVSENRSSAAMTRNFGLGLSFVHSVVMRHGGRIDVESRSGEGTTFKLYFPAASIE